MKKEEALSMVNAALDATLAVTHPHVARIPSGALAALLVRVDEQAYQRGRDDAVVDVLCVHDWMQADPRVCSKCGERETP